MSKNWNQQFKLLLAFVLIAVVSCKNPQQPTATVSSDPKVTNLKLPDGFYAAHLYSPGENEQGSWVAMTFDNEGRMIACDQFGNLYRVIIFNNRSILTRSES